MIYLEPPFHLIQGVTIFSDHADPLQFYYLPMMPHLTTKEDELTGQAIPQIQLIKYRGAAGGGGFLNFDVNLGIDQDRLEEIRQELRQIHRLDELPRIAPVPLLDGTVKLMMLGKESGNQTTTSENNQPQFVIQMNHAAKPALFGSNQASFSVALDEAGIVVVEKAMEGALLPIGIIYSLDYLALRPAYSVKLNVDWDRTQHHLQESFGFDSFIFSAQIDKVVDKLIEDRVIELQIDSFIQLGEDASDIKARLDQAVVEVKEMVLENFFEPSLDPVPKPEESGWDKAVNAFGRITAIHATGGASEAGFSLKKNDLTRIDKKRLDVNMTERTTVKRSIYPQAHLQGLFKVVREEGIDLSRFVLGVDIDDPWFKKRQVRVISRANFAKDEIESLNVKLNYGGIPKNTLLDATKAQDNFTWNSHLNNNKMVRSVKASYEVAFKNIDRGERPVKLISPETLVEVDNYEVRPHELYSLVPISIMALDFPWEVFPHVEIEVRYEDIDNGIKIEDHFRLDAQTTTTIWKLFSLNPEKDTFQYKLTYRAANHKDIEMPWETTTEEKVVIRDPYPSKRKLQIVPAYNWSEISMVFVDIQYIDEANGIRENQSIEFSSENKRPKSIIINQFVNPEHRFLDYKVTTIYNDGRMRESPPSTTISDRIIITAQTKGHRIITVKPEADFFDNGLKEVEIILKYEDSQAGLSYMDSFNFRSVEDRPRYFEFDYADTQKSTFSYQLIYTHKNGLQSTSGWKQTKANNLRIEAV